MVDDSVYGSALVQNQDSLAHFFLLDNNNFKRFKNRETFTPILQFNNFNQFETRYHFADTGDFYLIFQNIGSVAKTVWLRFYLTRP
jgi:hypothetical protein